MSENNEQDNQEPVPKEVEAPDLIIVTESEEPSEQPAPKE